MSIKNTKRGGKISPNHIYLRPITTKTLTNTSAKSEPRWSFGKANIGLHHTTHMVGYIGIVIFIEDDDARTTSGKSNGG
jgi:hypothetical protein